MSTPLYSEWRGGFDLGLVEMCSDWVTIATVKKQDDSGGYIYNPPITYGQLPTTGTTNIFASTPSKDPFFAQTSNDPNQPALFRCQFIIYQKDAREVGIGHGLLLAGKYVLPAAPWVNYQALMNQYNWFYRRDNTDFQNPKGFEKVNVTSISAKHDLNRNIAHYQLEVAR